MLALMIMTKPAKGFAATATIPGYYGQVQAPAINTLPQPRGNSFTGVESIMTDSSKNVMVINQKQQYATINWNSFNIGANALVYFSQKNAQGTAQSNWVALNRIYDKNPSLIYGSLKADGEILLINRNGILFGPGSQVNVNALVASALDITDKNFNAGLMAFSTTTGDYTGTLGQDVMVANCGTITTNNGGFVALVAPQVVNSGTISSPYGNIDLIGVSQSQLGSGQIDVDFVPNSNPTTYDIVYNVNANPGIATNTTTGNLISDSGVVDMQGATVNQNGLIRAVSTVQTAGAVYLFATDTVTTGPNSLTSTPVSDSPDKVSTTFNYRGGVINIGGIYTSSDGTAAGTLKLYSLNSIVNNGAIVAPRGTVTLDAGQLVYLESGSSINVGGLWVNEPVSANQVDAQLNSVELADFYNQKNGDLLGQSIGTTMQNGSSIGNISGSYTSADMSAQEQSTIGGSIYIKSEGLSPLKEFIAKQGATLDFSGGGFSYASGMVQESMLLSGTSVYNISNAPQNLTYTAILGDQTVSYAKYGITADFKGLYMGGGAPVNVFAPAFVAGSNAGTLSIQARQVVLDSTLNGSVTRGPYQTNTTSPETDNGSDYYESVARGLEEPVGGTLTIGSDPGPAAGGPVLASDFVTNAITVIPTSNPLPASFRPGDQLPSSQQSYLSAPILSSAGLSHLNLIANSTVTIEPGARISLLPSGSYTDSTSGSQVYLGGFTAKARSIIDQGVINAPDDQVELTLQDNVTTWPTVSGIANTSYVSSLNGKIVMGNGSQVNVVGETVDNFSAGNNPVSAVKFGNINGGSIIIKDNTIQGSTDGNSDSVIVQKGALLDVSGGYTIGSNGNVTGGGAGSLTLAGDTLSVAGDIRGFSLPADKGGTITLQAGEVVVASQADYLPGNLAIGDSIPVQLQGKLILGENQLASTGFSQIVLDSRHDVIFENGVNLAPSTVKSAMPVPAGMTASVSLSNSLLPTTAGDTLSPTYVGPTYVHATAGTNITPASSDYYGNPLLTDLAAQISIPNGSAINVVPGGGITLLTPSIVMAGTLEALGGNVSIQTTQSSLTIGSTGKILAGGYNLPNNTVIAGISAGPSPQSGGSVTLTTPQNSGSGNITLENGSLIDVSGSPATQVITSAANGTPLPVMAAGNPGSITFNFCGNLSLGGEIDGHPRLAGVQGGTLTINDNNSSSGFTISAADVNYYQGSGFDALTFKSLSSLDFQGSMDISAGRRLTLDAPSITAGNYNVITLSAPWLQLNNSSNIHSLQTVQFNSAVDTAKLTLSGNWVDVNGSVKLSGFSDVLASAKQDIQLTDANYNEGNQGTYAYYGNLNTDGNLTLQAARIYPTTLTGFTVNAGESVTILPSAVSNSSPIYSAGGSLAITAVQGIDVSSGSVLAAPMGTISLSSNSQNGRVYLASGSLVTTSSDTSVNYGTYDGTNWYGKDYGGGSLDQQVTAAPASTITIKGSEVIVMNGAKLDFSGGGSVFSYMYQPDIEGTTDPISTVGISQLTGLVTRPNRYVILPDNSVQMPGFSYTNASGNLQVGGGAIYLKGMQLDNGTYLKAGTYSLLPEQFAFVPGALIISDVGSTVAPGASVRTFAGYQVDGGYTTVLGTDIKSQVLEGYTIQSASTILQEGNFTVKQFTAGNAGSLTVIGNSAVMEGSINAEPLSGYNQGSLTMSGSIITVQEKATDLPGGFEFTTPLPASYAGQLQVSASSLSGQGLGSLTLGSLTGSYQTTTLTVKQGSILNFPNITLAANDSLTIESGAQVNGISQAGGGTVTLNPNAPNGSGTVDIQSNALVHASNSLTLNVNDLNLQGVIEVDKGGSLDLSAPQISFVPDSYVQTNGSVGIYLTEKVWQSFGSYGQLTLNSASGLNFQTDVNMTVGGTLTIDASLYNGPANVAFNAKEINLTSGSPAQISQLNPTSSGSLAMNADEITVSLNSATAPSSNHYGDILFNGFGAVNLSSNSDLTLVGVGALKTTGDLNLTAARVTTSDFSDANNPYVAANFLIDTTLGNGAISISNSGGAAGSTTTSGGTLTLQGRSINQSGTIEVASGQVQLTATGTGTNDGIFLTAGAQILAQGTKQETADPNTYDYSPGGQITLQSNSGAVSLASGSTLNVSAAEQGDAGAITLIAPTSGVTMNGNLLGNAANGKGGMFTLDSNTAELTALAGKLWDGGFTEQISIRARQGELTLGAGQTLTAAGIMLEADGVNSVGGDILINGTIKATDGTNGGSVDLDAQNNLTVNGSILANGAAGGQVSLGSESANGMVTLANTGVINVSGTGGSVTFRAQQNGNGVNMTLPGQIIGASQIVAEAFKVYTYNDPTNPTNSNYIYTMNSGDLSTWLNDASNYINAMSNNLGSLFGSNYNSSQYHFRPGIEIQSYGSITLPSTFDSLSTALDLSSFRFGPANEPGVLTLRAGGDLDIYGYLVDHSTSSYNTLYSTTMQPSWGFNLVAGADLTAANPLAVTAGSGNLNIGSSVNNVVVYTESAPIRFASGNNTTIYEGVAAGYMITGSSPSNDTNNGATISPMSYTLASYGGNIQGEVGNDLIFSSTGGPYATATAAIQTATGNINIKIRGDLDLYDYASGTLGAIRTTGEYAAGTSVENVPGSVQSMGNAVITDYWTYQNGGNISIDVGGSVNGDVNNLTSRNDPGLYNAWDYYYGGVPGSTNQYLAASFEGANSTQGIATMGGGDIGVRTGGSFNCQIGAFGTQSTGNLDIVTGGDLTGRFRVMNGTAALTSGGNFGTQKNWQVIELGNSQFTVKAQGDVYLGTVLNPDITRLNPLLNNGLNGWDLTYDYTGNPAYQGSSDTSVSISSLTGNLTYAGESSLTGNSTGTKNFDGYPSTRYFGNNQQILPPSVSFLAAGNINLENNIFLSPSPTGNIQLFAGGSIYGTPQGKGSEAYFPVVYMIDTAPATWYGYKSTRAPSELGNSLIHQEDENPVQILAGQDIQDLQLILTKEADISAGQDILQLVYMGENISPTDVTSIIAGRDIDYIYNPATNPILPSAQTYGKYGIVQGGPGTLVVAAGSNIDLGNSYGIQTIGNFANSSLSSTGSDIIIGVGTKSNQFQPANVETFFNELQQAGVQYSDLLAEGDTAAAQLAITQERSDFISKLIGPPPIDGSGTLNMVQSQICTVDGKSDIYIMTSGDLNVGITSLSSSPAQDTGIYTAGGGSVNIFSGSDVNVNESRIMTFLGGDITVWSDQGSINAGRGSKTTINVSAPYYNTITHKLVFQPPAIGSGIRAVTSNIGGLLSIPTPGDIYLFAPQGVIDAGEAGISGSKVVLGATEVLNVKNISFTVSSVGVPTAESSVSLGSLAGAGSVAETSKMVAQSSSLGGANDNLTQQTNMVDQFLSQFLDVKVINFDTDEGNTDNDKQDEKKKKR